MLKINIIGAGLAGSECALYLANKGYKVHLFDIKTKAKTPAHHSNDFAEIVCSNSFKSDDENTASGVFKRELILLGSELVKTAYEVKLRDYLMHRIECEIPYCKLNGHRSKRLANNVNFSFEFIEGEALLLSLDAKGICASSGSACTSGSLDPSHVLLSLGIPHEKAHGSIRFSLGDMTTEEQIDYVLEKMPPIVERMRQMSPLYEDFLKEQNK